MQLASDEESVQSLNVEDSADHTGKKRLANRAQPETKAVAGLTANS